MVAVLVLALTVGLAASVYSTFLRPPQVAEPRPADAVVVLGGKPYERYEYGRELVEQGLAGTLIMSAPRDRFPGMDRLCAPIPGAYVRCFIADPWTTRGEAQEIGRLARAGGWDSVIVVTQRTHLSRANTLIRRCFDGDVQMVASPERLGPVRSATELVYQSGAWFKVTVNRRC